MVLYPEAKLGSGGNE